MTMSENLPVAYDAGKPADLPIKLKPKALARQKKAERLAEAKAYSDLGCKLLALNVKQFAIIGQHVDRLGVKHIGHGMLISANDSANTQIAECDAIIKELLAKDPPCDPSEIIALKQLQRDFNRQVIDVAEAHIRADRLVNGHQDDSHIRIPFAPGQPLAVAVGQPSPKPAPSIEDAPPKG